MHLKPLFSSSTFSLSNASWKKFAHCKELWHAYKNPSIAAPPHSQRSDILCIYILHQIRAWFLVAFSLIEKWMTTFIRLLANNKFENFSCLLTSTMLQLRSMNEEGGQKKLNKLMLITNDTLKTIIMIFAHTFYGHFFSSEFQNFRIPGDILSIRYTQREQGKLCKWCCFNI